jgi:chemotaxis protein CheY-P-specific phosphatase CheC
MNSAQIVTTDDILLKLCHSVSHVLSSTSASQVTHAGMVQTINRTRLKPDLGCFSIFDGGFSGLVIINFSADAAIEIYRRYMINMGMPETDLAFTHTSDDVGNVMGELMNQILGDFIGKVSKELQTSISQSQPKMLTINKELTISIDANLDNPVARRVSFKTQSNHIFYLEFAMDNTEFIASAEFEMDEEFDPDSLLEQHGSSLAEHKKKPNKARKSAKKATSKPAVSPAKKAVPAVKADRLNNPEVKGIVADDADDLLSELGL